jgi:hypothetical protein
LGGFRGRWILYGRLACLERLAVSGCDVVVVEKMGRGDGLGDRKVMEGNIGKYVVGRRRVNLLKTTTFSDGRYLPEMVAPKWVICW